MQPYPISLGFIGAGGWADACLRACARSDRIRIAGVFDLSEEVAEHQAERYDCVVYQSLEEALGADDVHGLVVTLPPDENLEHVRKAAAAGKHCMVAKPIALTVRDAREMQRLCAEAGLVLLVGHQDRRRAEVCEAKRLIEAGEIGQPVMFEGNFSHMGGWGLSEGHWRARRSRCPTVPLMMLGIHVLDDMNYLVGPATAVKAFHAHAAIAAQNEDLSAAIFELEGGGLAYVGDSYCSPQQHWMRVLGTKMALEIEIGELWAVDAQGRRTQLELPECPGSDPQFELMEEFVRAIAEGVQPETDAEASTAALACAEGALRSAQGDGRVLLTEILGSV